MDVALKNISIELPETDLSFIEALVRKMGWTLKSQEDVLPVKDIPATTNVYKQYSPRIQYLRSLRGKGITPKDLEDDERLSYLLSR